MKRIYVVCEGKTEVLFVKGVLNSDFALQNIEFVPVGIGKNENKKGGGHITIERVLTDVYRHLSNPHVYCTTFLDFYGLPPDFPGKQKSKNANSVKEKSWLICDNLMDYISKQTGDMARRFIPYVQMHEFEGLLFSDPPKFNDMGLSPQIVAQLQKIRNSFETPEHINDSQYTAPSKRILSLVKQYQKPTSGLIIAKAIGLSTMRQECPIFNTWLNHLSQLPVLE
jgi:hypothetical protein